MTAFLVRALLAVVGMLFVISLGSGRAVWTFGLTGKDARRRAAVFMLQTRMATTVLAAMLGFALSSAEQPAEIEHHLPLILFGLALLFGAGLLETMALLARATEQPWIPSAFTEADILAQVLSEAPHWLSSWRRTQPPALLLKVPAAPVFARWAAVVAAWLVGSLVALSGSLALWL